MANTKYIVTANAGATLRKSASIQSGKITVLKKGTIITCTTSTNGYYYATSGNKKGYVQKQSVKKYTGESKTVNNNANPETTVKSIKSNTNQSNASKLLTNNLTGIYGIPYQFMDTVDRRLSDDTTFGRKYAEKIVGRMPLLFLTPGRQEFMTEFNKTDKKNVLNKLVDKYEIE